MRNGSTASRLSSRQQRSLTRAYESRGNSVSQGDWEIYHRRREDSKSATSAAKAVIRALRTNRYDPATGAGIITNDSDSYLERADGDRYSYSEQPSQPWGNFDDEWYINPISYDNDSRDDSYCGDIQRYNRQQRHLTPSPTQEYCHPSRQRQEAQCLDSDARDGNESNSKYSNVSSPFVPTSTGSSVSLTRNKDTISGTSVSSRRHPSRQEQEAQRPDSDSRGKTESNPEYSHVPSHLTQTLTSTGSSVSCRRNKDKRPRFRMSWRRNKTRKLDSKKRSSPQKEVQEKESSPPLIRRRSRSSNTESGRSRRQKEEAASVESDMSELDDTGVNAPLSSSHKGDETGSEMHTSDEKTFNNPKKIYRTTRRKHGSANNIAEKSLPTDRLHRRRRHDVSDDASDEYSESSSIVTPESEQPAQARPQPPPNTSKAQDISGIVCTGGIDLERKEIRSFHGKEGMDSVSPDDSVSESCLGSDHDRQFPIKDKREQRTIGIATVDHDESKQQQKHTISKPKASRSNRTGSKTSEPPRKSEGISLVSYNEITHDLKEAGLCKLDSLQMEKNQPTFDLDEEKIQPTDSIIGKTILPEHTHLVDRIETFTPNTRGKGLDLVTREELFQDLEKTGSQWIDNTKKFEFARNGSLIGRIIEPKEVKALVEKVSTEAEWNIEAKKPLEEEEEKSLRSLQIREVTLQALNTDNPKNEMKSSMWTTLTTIESDEFITNPRNSSTEKSQHSASVLTKPSLPEIRSPRGSHWKKRRLSARTKRVPQKNTPDKEAALQRKPRPKNAKQRPTSENMFIASSSFASEGTSTLDGEDDGVEVVLEETKAVENSVESEVLPLESNTDTNIVIPPQKNESLDESNELTKFLEDKMSTESRFFSPLKALRGFFRKRKFRIRRVTRPNGSKFRPDPTSSHTKISRHSSPGKKLLRFPKSSKKSHFMVHQTEEQDEYDLDIPTGLQIRRDSRSTHHEDKATSNRRSEVCYSHHIAQQDTKRKQSEEADDDDQTEAELVEINSIYNRRVVISPTKLSSKDFRREATPRPIKSNPGQADHTSDKDDTDSLDSSKKSPCSSQTTPTPEVAASGQSITRLLPGSYAPASDNIIASPKRSYSSVRSPELTLRTPSKPSTIASKRREPGTNPDADSLMEKDSFASPLANGSNQTSEDQGQGGRETKETTWVKRPKAPAAGFPNKTTGKEPYRSEAALSEEALIDKRKNCNKSRTAPSKAYKRQQGRHSNCRTNSEKNKQQQPSQHQINPFRSPLSLLTTKKSKRSTTMVKNKKKRNRNSTMRPQKRVSRRRQNGDGRIHRVAEEARRPQVKSGTFAATPRYEKDLEKKGVTFSKDIALVHQFKAESELMTLDPRSSVRSMASSTICHPAEMYPRKSLPLDKKQAKTEGSEFTHRLPLSIDSQRKRSTTIDRNRAEPEEESTDGIEMIARRTKSGKNAVLISKTSKQENEVTHTPAHTLFNPRKKGLAHLTNPLRLIFLKKSHENELAKGKPCENETEMNSSSILQSSKASALVDRLQSSNNDRGVSQTKNTTNIESNVRNQANDGNGHPSSAMKLSTIGGSADDFSSLASDDGPNNDSLIPTSSSMFSDVSTLEGNISTLEENDLDGGDVLSWIMSGLFGYSQEPREKVLTLNAAVGYEQVNRATKYHNGRINDAQFQNILDATRTLAEQYTEAQDMTDEESHSISDETIQQVNDAIATIRGHAVRLGIQEEELINAIRDDDRTLRSGLLDSLSSRQLGTEGATDGSAAKENFAGMLEYYFAPTTLSESASSDTGFSFE